MWVQSFGISIFRLVICLSCCVLSSSAPLNLDMVLKQLELQQMQMHVLRVKSGERKSTKEPDRERSDRHRGYQRHFYNSL